MALLVLTNCAVYHTVQQSPKYIDHQRTIILYKDELRFWLTETQTRSDTLFGKISHDIIDPALDTKMIVVLKPEQQLEQDELGMLIIPFSSIYYIEYYKEDLRKSNNQTVFVITTGVVVGFLFFVLIPLLLMGAPLDEWNP